MKPTLKKLQTDLMLRWELAVHHPQYILSSRDNHLLVNTDSLMKPLMNPRKQNVLHWNTHVFSQSTPVIVLRAFYLRFFANYRGDGWLGRAYWQTEGFKGPSCGRGLVQSFLFSTAAFELADDALFCLMVRPSLSETLEIVIGAAKTWKRQTRMKQCIRGYNNSLNAISGWQQLYRMLRKLYAGKTVLYCIYFESRIQTKQVQIQDVRS